MSLRFLDTSRLDDTVLGHTSYYLATSARRSPIDTIKQFSVKRNLTPKRLFNSCMHAKASLARARGSSPSPHHTHHLNALHVNDMTWAMAKGSQVRIHKLAHPSLAVTRSPQPSHRYQRSLLTFQQLQQRRLQRQQSLFSATAGLSSLEDASFLPHQSRCQDLYAVKSRRKKCPHRLRRFFLASTQQPSHSSITSPSSVGGGLFSRTPATVMHDAISPTATSSANNGRPAPVDQQLLETSPTVVTHPSTPFVTGVGSDAYHHHHQQQQQHSTRLSQAAATVSPIVDGIEEDEMGGIGSTTGQGNGFIHLEQDDSEYEDEDEEEDDEDDEDDGIEIEVNPSGSNRDDHSSSALNHHQHLNCSSPRFDDMHHFPHYDHLHHHQQRSRDEDEMQLSEANLAQLEQIKQEGFRELALQTQQHSELFVAKMVYWESLSPEEKSHWLASQQQHQQQQQQEQQQHELQQKQQPEASWSSSSFSSAATSSMSLPPGQSAADMDELIAALECRATVKDYSALLAYEKRRLAAAAAASSPTIKSHEPIMSSASSFMSVSRSSVDSSYSMEL